MQKAIRNLSQTQFMNEKYRICWNVYIDMMFVVYTAEKCKNIFSHSS